MYGLKKNKKEKHSDFVIRLRRKEKGCRIYYKIDVSLPFLVFISPLHKLFITFLLVTLAKRKEVN